MRLSVVHPEKERGGVVDAKPVEHRCGGTVGAVPGLVGAVEFALGKGDLLVSAQGPVAVMEADGVKPGISAGEDGGVGGSGERYRRKSIFEDDAIRCQAVQERAGGWGVTVAPQVVSPEGVQRYQDDSPGCRLLRSCCTVYDASRF